MTDSFVVGVGGGENWDQSYAGAGVADGAAQIIKSIQDGDWASASVNALTASIDVLGFIDNPVKAIGTSVIGWLLEHISFLDWYLDHTVGDPQAVQSAAESFYRAAQELDKVAAEQIRSFSTGVNTYRQGGSKSAQEFESRVGPRGDELRTLSLQCLGLGHAMNDAGMIVATCRGLMRDLLTEFTWWVIKKATIALAAAPYTAGGSLAALLTDTVTFAARTATKLADKLTEMTHALGGLFKMLRQLAGLLDPSAKVNTLVAMTKNFAPSAAKAWDDRVSLSAADDAEEQVAAQEAERAASQRKTEQTGQPQFAPNPPPTRHGPGLGARWTTSGTLDS